MTENEYMWTGKCPIWKGVGHKRGEVVTFTEAAAAKPLAYGAVVPKDIGDAAEKLVVESKGRLTFADALERVKSKVKTPEKVLEKVEVK
jgi:hypothetical protein